MQRLLAIATTKQMLGESISGLIQHERLSEDTDLTNGTTPSRAEAVLNICILQKCVANFNRIFDHFQLFEGKILEIFEKYSWPRGLRYPGGIKAISQGLSAAIPLESNQ